MRRLRCCPFLLVPVLASVAFAGYAAQEPVRRLMDAVGFVDAYNAGRIESHLRYVYNESGVDIRFIFARELPADLESFALKRIRELGIGRDADKRGLLFVYDVGRQRMRVEVGPGLEGIFPDGFVGYLMRQQTAALFATGDRVLGLKSTLFIVSNRLREAALGQSYDPSAIVYITDSVRLAAGGGATARAPVGSDRGALRAGAATNAVRARFGPQPTVADAHARYLEALRDGHFQPDLPLYAPGTEAVLRRFPIAAPYAGFILYSEYGHQYRIVERGNLAILFFTTTPLVSTHHFRRSPDGWQMDIAADVRNTRERIGSRHTWEMILSGDEYTKAFGHLYADYEGLLRPARGDNRPLPMRKR